MSLAVMVFTTATENEIGHQGNRGDQCDSSSESSLAVMLRRHWVGGSVGSRVCIAQRVLGGEGLSEDFRVTALLEAIQ